MKVTKNEYSRYGIWLNERAFPGEAVNTIGFSLYLPDCDAQKGKEAADRLLTKAAVFHMRMRREADACVLEKTESCAGSRMGELLKKEEADRLWERLSQEPFREKLYEFQVFPVAEGGSFLIVRFHHILIDGFSMCQIAQGFLNELAGRADADPVNWQSDPLQKGADPVHEEDPEKFWMSYFDGMDGPTELFSGRTRGLKRTWHRFSLGADLTEKIKAFAQAQDLTEAAVFSGALILYLSRAGRKTEAAFLMPRLGRKTEEEMKRVGCCTLVAPVRVRTEEGMTFARLCAQARTQAKRASEYKEYGMERILSVVHNSGILSGNISEYVLNFYTPKITAPFPFEIHMSMDGAMHNHLTLNITAFQDSYEILYDARDGIYTEERTEAFHEALISIIRQGIAQENQDLPISEIEIVGVREREKLLSMSGERVPVSETDAIPDLFRKAAARFPERPALYAGDKAYSFQELDGVSSRVANALLAQGIRQGQPVMFKLRRDACLLPVMLGILKAGAAFIPIDPEYPQGRIAYIQENSGADCLIVNEARCKEEREAMRERQVTVFSAEQLLEFPDASDPELYIPQEQMAYCIYTSGTTGRPKGVQLSHKGIVNITHPGNNPFNKDISRCGTGIVAIGSICFDISLFEIFVPLFSGMFIELAPEQALANPKELSGLLEAHGANMLHCTPSRLTAYLHEEAFAKALSGVEVILAAGETLPGSLVDELKDKFGIRIYNGYGPTETTIGATITEAGDNRTIGRPIANMGIMILDESGRLLPYGVSGELCIYGNGVGIGYRNLPKETEKRFFRRYERRMYRTGDLGRFAEDGRILYQGRNDFQVKLRGLRIELAEIENCIMGVDAVGAAAVQVRKIGGREHLAAFYTVKKGAAFSAEALREHCRANLTVYMVPDIFKELSEIPQTPGGKTDLKALEKIAVEYTAHYREPKNEYEKAICEAFEKTLEAEMVGAGDNFFELGGDSLHIAVLMSEIETRLPGTELLFEDVFQYPVPELLAQHLYRKKAKVDKEEKNPLEELSYQGFSQLLKENARSDGEKEIKTHSLGRVLLTGATGFLGIHILMELMKQKECFTEIYALVRPTKRQTPEKRLKNLLFYFESTDFDELIGTRVFAVPGDITQEGVFEEPLEVKFDTVINCAADVSHFAYDDKLERINTGGVKNLLSFCRANKAALIQISTISVGGVYRKEKPPLTLTEQDLFLGQEIRNQYIHSKYMAEYEILRSAVKDALPVKLMRVGNLQGRLSDGEFQMNRRSNAFTRQISSYIKIGKVPQSLFESTVNFSPVDEVARMIVNLGRLPEKYRVFHVFPEKEVAFRKLFETAAKLGYATEVVSDAAFEHYIKELGSEKKGLELLEGILVERPDLAYADTKVTQEFTGNILRQLGVSWNEITDGYLEKYFRALDEFGVFEEGLL